MGLVSSPRMAIHGAATCHRGFVAHFAQVVVLRGPLSLPRLYPNMGVNDFGDSMDDDKVKDGGKGKDGDKGIKRSWLKAFETAPSQMLSVYGLANFLNLPDEEVWESATLPLKSGAMYMTEYASNDPERRGIGINRWLKSLFDYMAYQQGEEQKKKNKFILRENVYKMFYDEIDRMLPAVQYCLAPKKVSTPVGAAALRSCSGMRSSSSSQELVREADKLNEYASTLYDWMDPDKVSRIRMMLHYQGCGGLPYCASVHHRITQCFRQHGNSKHDTKGAAVSLGEFQVAIKERHRIGDDGMLGPGTIGGADDFI